MAETSSFFSPVGCRESSSASSSLEQDKRPLAIRASRRQTKAAASSCGICLEAVDDQGFLMTRVSGVAPTPACTHAFCFACILTWSERTNTCPMCKARFSAIRHNAKPGRGALSGDIVEVQHRDQAANCSSDEELAAALAAADSSSSNDSDNISDSSNSDRDDGSNRDECDDEARSGGERGRMGTHGYVSDGFLVADSSSDESVGDDEDGESWQGRDLERPSSTTRPTRRQTANGRDSGGGGAGGGSSVAGTSRRSRARGGRVRVEDERIDSPILGFRGRRRDPTAWTGAAASERPPRRRRRTGADNGDDESLEEELRQLQEEAARLVGDSPLRPRRRPPPPSRLSRYPRRNNVSTATTSSAGAAVTAVARDRGATGTTRYGSPWTGQSTEGDEGSGESTRDTSSRRRLQRSRPSAASSTASGAASGDASISRQRRVQRRRRQQQQQQLGDESDSWCASSSEYGPQGLSGDEEENSEAESLSLELPSEASGRRGESGGRGRGETMMRVASRAATAAATAPPTRHPSPSSSSLAPAVASSRGNGATSITSGGTSGYGLTAALGSDRRAGGWFSSAGSNGSTARAAQWLVRRSGSGSASADGGQWMTRRTGSSSGGGERQARLPWRPSSSFVVSETSRPWPSGMANGVAPLSMVLADAATRVIGTSQRLRGLRSRADSATASAPTAASAVAEGSGRAEQRDGVEGEEEESRGPRKRAIDDDAGGSSDDDMAEDIWMEQVPMASPRRAQRSVAAATERERVGDVGRERRGSGRGAVEPLRSSPQAPPLGCQGLESGEEEEEEEAEFDWRVRDAASPSVSDKKPQANIRSDGKPEERQAEGMKEEALFECHGGGGASSRGKGPGAAPNNKRRRGAASGVQQEQLDNSVGEEPLRTSPEGRCREETEQIQRGAEGSNSCARLPWRNRNKENGAPWKGTKKAAGDGPSSGCLWACEGNDAVDDDGCSSYDERGGGTKRRRRQGRGEGVRSRGGEGSLRGSSPPTSPLEAAGFLDQFRYTGDSSWPGIERGVRF